MADTRKRKRAMPSHPEGPFVGSVPRPVHPALVAAPIVCFAGALATDVAYAATANILWSDFSDWLLAAGMALAAIGFVVALVTIAVDRRVRAARSVWPFVLGSVVVLIVAFVDNLVHSRDAWTSVVPEGLVLSAATVLVALVTSWLATARGRVSGARPVETR